MNWYEACDQLVGLKWKAVDFDGTLLTNDGPNPKDPHEIRGEPIEKMVATVKEWIAKGHSVCLFTARVGPTHDGRDYAVVRNKLKEWCLEHLGAVIPITCIKSRNIRAIYDDRAFRVTRNKGIIQGEQCPTN